LQAPVRSFAKLKEPARGCKRLQEAERFLWARAESEGEDPPSPRLRRAGEEEEGD
jgi:hypothetical protein